MKYIQMSLYDTANGKGIRTTLWVAGCIHHCKGCHNPNTWDCNNGIEFTENDLNYLVESLRKEYIDGVTLSGGDPLFEGNRDTVEYICKYIKKEMPDKSIWVYTGYLWEEVKNLNLMNYIDVLVDGKFDISKKDVSLPFCGSSNQRVIDVKESLVSDKGVILYS